MHTFKVVQLDTSSKKNFSVLSLSHFFLVSGVFFLLWGVGGFDVVFWLLFYLLR